MCYKQLVPKIVDHDRRRAELGDAVLRVVSREGFAAASIRAVAAEAGWSVGAVRHYFGTVDELLRFSFDQLTEHMRARLDDVAASSAPPREKAQRLLEELLPLDERRQSEQRLWLELVTRSRFDARMRPQTTYSYESTRWLVRAAVCLVRGLTGHEAAEPLDDPRLERLVGDLNVYLDGLWFQGVAYEERPPEQLRADLARALEVVANAPLGSD